MAQLYRAWFRAKKDGRYIAGYKADTADDFGVELTDDPEQAVSMITDRTAAFEVEDRLFQALIRHPDPAGEPLNMATALDAFQVVRQFFEVATLPVSAGTEEGREITWVVDSAQVDLDKFGAEHQISRDDNRLVDLDEGDWAQLRFTVLQAQRYVDDLTGAYYPGMTVRHADEAVFWALPDEFMTWAEVVSQLDIFPCTVQFTKTPDGKPYAALQLPLAAEEE